MARFALLVFAACLIFIPAGYAREHSLHNRQLVGPDPVETRYFASRERYIDSSDDDSHANAPSALQGDDNQDSPADDGDEDTDLPDLSNSEDNYYEVLGYCEEITAANVTDNSTEAATEATHHEKEGRCDKDDELWAVWLCFYIFIILFLFIGIAIICDDFFVPSLEVISERLELSEDVAGATFMAAGSSAPELFTSVAGVGVESDVGVGTIVGSAVFNLLVIIAFTTLLARKVLDIDWRPLVRDSVFYAFSIVAFIIMSWDGKFLWWEALILLFLYFLYILTMKFNPQLMECMGGCAKSEEEPAAGENGEAVTSFTSNGASTANVDDPKSSSDGNDDDEEEDTLITLLPCLPKIKVSVPERPSECGFVACLKYVGMWILFVLAFPWLIAFTWTIPDCSKEHNKRWYLVSFFMSILWIALISFLMVEASEVVGCILSIDSYTMGLVVIATGTSVPDALSSILVARDGFGNMAVSNAIGSNVFDINLGLGLPFLIGTLARNKPISLLTPVQECLLDNLPGALDIIPHVKFGLILLLILLLCLMLFAAVRFRLRKIIGLVFFSMYLMFLAYAFVQEKLCHGMTC